MPRLLKRYVGVWIACLAVAGVAGLTLVFRHHLPTDGSFDLPSSIHQIASNNQKINTTNENIVGDLKSVEQLSGTSFQMESALHQTSSSLTAQASSLSQLKALSDQEKYYSQNFVSLASKLGQNLSGIRDSAASQDDAIQSMNSTLQSLNSESQTLGSITDELTNNLQTADERTKTVSNSMP